jgi:hypothetical protein
MGQQPRREVKESCLATWGTPSATAGKTPFQLGTAPSQLGLSPFQLGTAPSQFGTGPASQLGTAPEQLGQSPRLLESLLRGHEALEALGIGCTRPTERPPHSLQEYDEWALAGGVAYDSAVLNKKAKHSQCSGVYWLPARGRWMMAFQFQYSSVHEVTEPKADGGFGVDVVRRLIYYGSSTALKLTAVRLVLSTDSESEACMAWGYCLGNARVLGLHSPQHYPNPIGKFSFGTSGQQILERNYDDVTHVEYHRVLPVELQSRGTKAPQQRNNQH